MLSRKYYQEKATERKLAVIQNAIETASYKGEDSVSFELNKAYLFSPKVVDELVKLGYKLDFGIWNRKITVTFYDSID